MSARAGSLILLVQLGFLSGCWSTTDPPDGGIGLDARVEADGGAADSSTTGVGLDARVEADGGAADSSTTERPDVGVGLDARVEADGGPGGLDAGSPDVPADGGLQDSGLSDAPSADAPHRTCSNELDCTRLDGCLASWISCSPDHPDADEEGCVYLARSTPLVCGGGYVCGLPGMGCIACADEDGDHYPAMWCGGTDCNDESALAHPGGPQDLCDGLDNDCDGVVDNQPAIVWEDADGDGYGSNDPGAMWGTVPCGTPGFSEVRGDCNDSDPTFHPGAPELCDGRDTNCNGRYEALGEDDDFDGYVSIACGGNDCDDLDAATHPWALEVLCDGIDQDCDGLALEDRDGDGVLEPPCGVDCNDYDASVGAVDGDGDGHAPYMCINGDDCDDANALFHPGADEICNLVSETCDPSNWRGEDWDLDGYASLAYVCRDDLPGALPRQDCQDFEVSIAPGRPELCDGIDNDCDPSTADGTSADNLCLPGHACAGGACRQSVTLTAIGYRTCALLVDGTVRCWGQVRCAEGSAINSDCFTPSNVFGWSDVVALDPHATCMMNGSGQVFDWLGAERTGLPPVAILGPRCDCVVRADTGGLWCAGVGDLAGPTNIVQLDEGCARTASGEVWCWGANRYGQVGDGTTIDRAAPVRVISSNAIDIAGEPNAPVGASSERCAALSDGTVRCWGRGVLSPTVVTGVSSVTEIAYGNGLIALRAAADATSPRAAPYAGTSNLHGLVSGYNRGCAFTSDERVICFGSGTSALGLPERSPRPTLPVTVGGL